MKYTEKDCIEDTNKHIIQVGDNIKKIITELHSRILKHDLSKLEESELSGFTKLTPKLKGSTYGSEEYKGFLKELGVVLEHHYQHNRHHPEYFVYHECNGCFKRYYKEVNVCSICGYSQFTERFDISRMNLVDIMEMFCDWLAATKRHNNGDIFKSIKSNEKRFSISSQLSSIFCNTAEQIFGEDYGI